MTNATGARAKAMSVSWRASSTSRNRLTATVLLTGAVRKLKNASNALASRESDSTTKTSSASTLERRPGWTGGNVSGGRRVWGSATGQLYGAEPGSVVSAEATREEPLFGRRALPHAELPQKPAALLDETDHPGVHEPAN